MASWIAMVLWTAGIYFFGMRVLEVLYNLFFHPLARFPGPFGARCTGWWKTYIEVVKQESMVDVLFKLHEESSLSWETRYADWI